MRNSARYRNTVWACRSGVLCAARRWLCCTVCCASLVNRHCPIRLLAPGSSINSLVFPFLFPLRSACSVYCTVGGCGMRRNQGDSLVGHSIGLPDVNLITGSLSTSIRTSSPETEWRCALPVQSSILSGALSLGFRCAPLH